MTGVARARMGGAGRGLGGLTGGHPRLGARGQVRPRAHLNAVCSRAKNGIRTAWFAPLACTAG